MSWLSCIGILITLVIAHQGAAVRLRSAFACQDKTLTIKCRGNGEKILVKRAMFGRKKYFKCWKPYALQWNINCEAPKSTSIAKAVCDGKKACSLVASYYVFEGDPCSKTEKYLTVDYICKAPANTAYTVQACQYSDARLICSRNKRIRVVYALYGRVNLTTCRRRFSFSFTTNCRAHGSLEEVKKICDGKRECTVFAMNSVFGRDPCPNVNKYLKIKFLCE